MLTRFEKVAAVTMNAPGGVYEGNHVQEVNPTQRPG